MLFHDCYTQMIHLPSSDHEPLGFPSHSYVSRTGALKSTSQLQQQTLLEDSSNEIDQRQDLKTLPPKCQSKCRGAWTDPTTIRGINMMLSDELRCLVISFLPEKLSSRKTLQGQPWQKLKNNEKHSSLRQSGVVSVWSNALYILLAITHLIIHYTSSDIPYRNLISLRLLSEFFFKISFLIRGP